MFITHLLLLIALLVSSSIAQEGTITSPQSDSAIQPGENFTFNYVSLADYGRSSFAIQVYLFTSPVNSVFFGNATGVSLGEFQIENYPAIPEEPKNPLPSYLIAPDFSKGLGWGAPEYVSNLSVTLLVAEFYRDGEASVGQKISTTSIPLIYNSTLV